MVFVPIKLQVIEAFDEEILRERNGELISPELLASVTNIFTTLSENQRKDEAVPSLYSELEKRIIRSTSSFYHRFGNTYIEEDSCADYMKKAEAALHAEEARVNQYLLATSRDALIGEVQR